MIHKVKVKLAEILIALVLAQWLGLWTYLLMKLFWFNKMLGFALALVMIVIALVAVALVMEPKD
ncbi:hypothetical protein LBLM1_05870 [Limosilactobacillus mucosae LM1]|uniref:Uncharacterized protein n=1 Tax=Limosilactobacillus mucosae LM1 TaxID=1130798 RepID=A0A0D4CL63_LIMMU|nr:hypothetical protein [Limosilactobacillus mucosae]AJT50606.1 hypothetical protein LBLM1_05870 [Limosilactobacillus mucosae LM1]